MSCLKASTVLTSGFASACPDGDAEGYARQIHVRAGSDPLLGDQVVEALAREDHDVGGHTAGELRSNGLRPRSLRRT